MTTKTIEVKRCYECPFICGDQQLVRGWKCIARNEPLVPKETLSRSVPLRCPLLGGKIEVINAFPQTEIEDVKMNY